MKALMILGPAFVGLNFYLYLKKRELSIMEMIMKYGVITLVTNLLEMGYLYLTMEYKYTEISYVSASVSFVFKYLLMGFFVALLVGLLFYVVEKSVDIDVEVEKEKRRIRHAKKQSRINKKERHI